MKRLLELPKAVQRLIRGRERSQAAGRPTAASHTDQLLDIRKNQTDNAPTGGKSRSKQIASVSRAERDRLIDRVRNITSQIEHAKIYAGAWGEAEVETPINRDIRWEGSRPQEIANRADDLRPIYCEQYKTDKSIWRTLENFHDNSRWTFEIITTSAAILAIITFIFLS